MDTQGLSIICAGLGTVEEDETGTRVGYTKGQYCLDNLKDLLRFLRRDDPQNRQVFKQICKWNIASKDLIPIIENYQDDQGLVLNAVKVLVFLTMPIEPTSSDIPEQIEYLWGIKTAITSSGIVAVIVSLLETPLENLESEAFSEDDWKLMQLVLTLFRNLLAVQDISPYQKAAGSVSQILSTRDKFIELLFRENVTDLILVICQHAGGSYSYLRQDNLLLLETFHYMFVGQDPELVAKAYLKYHKENENHTASLSSLRSIMDDEKDKRRISKLHTSSRHSLFSGTFTRLTMDGGKALVKGNPGLSSSDFLLESGRFSRGPTKKIVRDPGILPSVQENILKMLHDFMNQFISGGYNVLMQSIREDIEREHLQVQKSDIINFFKVAEFVTSFQYHKSLISQSDTEVNSYEHCNSNLEGNTIFKGTMCGPISASMNESMFQLVISRWRDAFDGLKETKDYSFLAAAGSLLKAMIRMLNLVLKLLPEDSVEPQTARILLYKLFYDQTDQGMTQFLLNVVKSFDQHKQSRSNLADLVEMVYIIVRLMERLQDRGTLRVSRKSRKRKKSKSSQRVKTEAAALADDATEQQEIEISNDMQSANRDVANQGNLSCEGQTSILPEAGISEMPDISPAGIEKDGEDQIQTGKSGFINDFSEESFDSSDDEQLIARNEVDFNVSTLVSALANNSIIHNLCWLLKFYKSNSIHTNHHIISILRKISDDLELSPMLYQLSLLNIFHEILLDQKSHPCKEYATIVNFLTDLVRRMLRKMKHQPLLFVELLFWKTRKECHHINADHLSHEVADLKKHNEDGRVLNGETRIGQSSTRRSIADALGDDEADVMIPYEFDLPIDDIHNAEASETASVTDAETSTKGGSDRFKGDEHCGELIAEALDSDGNVSSAQVKNRLKQLGLKITRKRRMSYPPDGKQPLEDGNAEETEDVSLISSDMLKTSKRRLSHTRKRISALSKDDEARIRTLFEKFKDHRRCSYMIAKSLDGDDSGTFTVAQISRKLKQLGLQVAGRKKTQEDLHLKEKTHNGSDNDNWDTDSETLTSLRLKSKSMKRSTKEFLNRGEDDSDEEPLSSVVRKSRPKKIRRPTNENETASVNRRDQSNGDTEGATLEDLIERDGSHRPDDLGIEAAEQATGFRDAISSGVCAEANMSIDMPKSPIGSVGGMSLQQLEDELDESGDDMSLDLSASVSINKRRKRVVLDDADDDD
ncbi:hypothetical protein SAY87_030809 [Trapa incisa]|uniref:Timeless N-terminal domain-containing protein n=1 Tax=Trapa incisa TaxID=236973 RepID=A0AAN7KNU1_9MYRT|nr:hypothetical protein SAY87_030809 [Trapa incisa]